MRLSVPTSALFLLLGAIGTASASNKLRGGNTVEQEAVTAAGSVAAENHGNLRAAAGSPDQHHRNLCGAPRGCCCNPGITCNKYACMGITAQFDKYNVNTVDKASGTVKNTKVVQGGHVGSGMNNVNNVGAAGGTDSEDSSGDVGDANQAAVLNANPGARPGLPGVSAEMNRIPEKDEIEEAGTEAEAGTEQQQQGQPSAESAPPADVQEILEEGEEYTEDLEAPPPARPAVPPQAEAAQPARPVKPAVAPDNIGHDNDPMLVGKPVPMPEPQGQQVQQVQETAWEPLTATSAAAAANAAAEAAANKPEVEPQDQAVQETAWVAPEPQAQAPQEAAASSAASAASEAAAIAGSPTLANLDPQQLDQVESEIVAHLSTTMCRTPSFPFTSAQPIDMSNCIHDWDCDMGCCSEYGIHDGVRSPRVCVQPYGPKFDILGLQCRGQVNNCMEINRLGPQDISIEAPLGTTGNNAGGATGAASSYAGVTVPGASIYNANAALNAATNNGKIPDMGQPGSGPCQYGSQCASGNCAAAPQVTGGACVPRGGVPRGWTLKAMNPPVNAAGPNKL